MLAVIVILSVLVVIHELGHFFVARWRGVTVEEFGLGYPPRAKALFTWKKTLFTLNWVPFGGFVRLAGEDSSSEAHEKNSPVKGLFYNASPISQLLVILAGAAVNFVFGIVIFSGLFSYTGIPMPIDEARIGEVAPGSPAAVAGVPKDVTVTGLVDSTGLRVPISTFSDLVNAVGQRKGQDVTLQTTGLCQGYVCAESQHEYKVRVRTDAETPAGQGSLGVLWGVAYVHYPWYQMPFKSTWYGFEQATYMGRQILQALGQMVSQLVIQGTVPQEVAGPVGIIHQAQTTGLMQQGFVNILFFAGMLSVNLAIMNILPIPPLDGGRAVFILLGTVIHKRHMAKVEYYANYGGYVALLLLIIAVTIRDVLRVIG